jgi:Flp pilus assembly secretin CpaC
MKQILLAVMFLGTIVVGWAQNTGAPPGMVTGEIRFIEAPRSVINRLVPTTAYVLKRDILLELEKLVQEKKAAILAQPRITTVSGQVAQVKSVREFKFPAELENHPMGGGGVMGGMSFEPTLMDTVEIGVILNFTPTVGADDHTIAVALSPEISLLAKPAFVKHVTTSPAGKTETLTR